MKSLTQLTVELKHVESVVNKDLSTIDPRTRSGWEAAKNQALAQLGQLKSEYHEAVIHATAGIFIIGAAASTQELAGIAEDEGNAITVHADALYRRIAAPIEAMMGSNRIFTVSQAARMIEEVVGVARELDVAEIPNPAAEQYVNGLVLQTNEDVVEFARTSIRATIGDDLNRLYLERLVSTEAAVRGYDQTVVPVVVLGASKEELGGDLFRKVFFGNNYVVKSGAKADKNKVIGVFNKIKEKVLASRGQPTPEADLSSEKAAQKTE